MDWHMRNAQDQLMQKRKPDRLRPAADIVKRVVPGQKWEVEPKVEAETQKRKVRTYRFTPLDEFRYDHLGADDEQRLRKAVGRAKNWMTAHLESPGLSFVLCGSVGTGKTTIAENLLHCFRHLAGPVEIDADGREHLIEELAFEALDGCLMTSTQLMDLMGGEYADENGVQAKHEPRLENTFGHRRCVVIDDVGDEEIMFSNERTFDTKRRNRYGRFLDYCYRAHKHVIITSNVPLLVRGANGKEVNQVFVDIFGDKGWDRLYQMASGYMSDLTGLPSYRRVLVDVD